MNRHATRARLEHVVWIQREFTHRRRQIQALPEIGRQASASQQLVEDVIVALALRLRSVHPVSTACVTCARTGGQL